MPRLSFHLRMLPTRLQVVGALIAALVMVSGCLRKPQNSFVNAAPSSLTIRGAVLDADQPPKTGVQIYLGSATTAIARAGQDGRYTVTLDAAALTQLQGELRSQTIRLYAVSDDTEALQAASAPINLATRGDIELATMTLAKAATIHGQVLQMTKAQQQSQPAARVRVIAGHSVTTTGDDGRFVIKNVAAGNIAVIAGPNLSHAATQALTVKPGEERQLKKPLVIFPLGGPRGLVVPDTDISVNDLVKQGKPYTRTFGVVADEDARYIRFSADEKELASDGSSTASWQKLSDSFDFDFQKTGASNLYYQFADAGRKQFSDVYTLALTLDNFGATTGLVLGDGSGLLTSNVAPVSVDVPPAAVRMRMAPSVDLLQTAPWQMPQPSFVFPFPLRRDPSTNFLQAFGTKTLYLQYLDASGMVSPTYTAVATLNMFPPVVSGQVFTVNGGAAVSPTRLVQLSINVPANAHEMLIFEADTPITNNIWLAAQPTSFYTFTSTGSKSLYLQFRTVDQAVSPVYKYPLIVQPFPDPTLGGFLINDGAPLALSPHLTVRLKIPPTATQFRIIDSAQMAQLNIANLDLWGSPGNAMAAASVVPWLEPRPLFIYTPRTSRGVTTIYVQYKNADHDVSPVYQQTIDIDPEPVGSGYFAINPEPLTGASALVSTSSLVMLRVVPPPGYLGGAMIVYEDRLPEPLATANIIPVPVPDPVTGAIPLVPYVLRGTGAHNVYVRFMTVDQNNVPVIATLSPTAYLRTVVLDPFPLNAVAVTINEGAANLTAAEALDARLNLRAPDNVTKMRYVVDDQPQLGAISMQPFAATVTNLSLPTAAGLHAVYVQFENSDGYQSPVYETVVTVLP
ncbi:MAG: hypothetical protein FJ146_11740 [Deltaproteobacteria bacterium]|nr:hypothetical protein [Deltaproteobacteria bacterium]